MLFCNDGAEDDDEDGRLDANQRKFNSGAGGGYWRCDSDCVPLSLVVCLV